MRAPSLLISSLLLGLVAAAQAQSTSEVRKSIDPELLKLIDACASLDISDEALEASGKAKEELVKRGAKALKAIAALMAEPTPEDQINLAYLLPDFGEACVPTLRELQEKGNELQKVGSATAISFMSGYFNLDDELNKGDGQEWALERQKEYSFLRKAEVLDLIKAQVAQWETLPYAVDSVINLQLVDTAELLHKMGTEGDHFGAIYGLYGLAGLKLDDLTTTLRLGEVFDNAREQIAAIEDEEEQSDVINFLADKLGKTKNEPSFKLIIKLLDDQEARYRQEACWILMRRDEKRAASQIETLLKDKDTLVRGYAMWALGGLDLAKYMPKVEEFSKSDNPELRGLAAFALRDGSTEGSKLGEKLAVKLSQDKIPYVRSAAITALGQIATPACRDALKKLVSDPEPEVRKSAKETLEYMEELEDPAGLDQE